MYRCTRTGSSADALCVPAGCDRLRGARDQPAQGDRRVHPPAADSRVRRRVRGRLRRPRVGRQARPAGRRRLRDVVRPRHGGDRGDRRGVPERADQHPEGRRGAARHRRRRGPEPGRCALTPRRDPEARRQRIVTAAVRAIAEVGAGNVTHRRIATLAGVPLGSTTYYFPTLDDLVAAALREAVEYSRAGLEVWAEELTVSRDLPATFVDLASRYLVDRGQA